MKAIRLDENIPNISVSGSTTSHDKHVHIMQTTVIALCIGLCALYITYGPNLFTFAYIVLLNNIIFVRNDLSFS